MARLREGRDPLKWARAWVNADHPVYKWLGILASVIAVLTFVGAVAFRERAGDAADALGDLLTSDLKAWHALVVFFAFGAFLLAARWRGHRSTTGAGSAALEPREISYLGVLWPVSIDRYMDATKTRFSVGKPMCPECRATLSLRPPKSDKLYTQWPKSDWSTLVASFMSFQCPKDGKQYDLRGPGQDMDDVVETVNDLAMGEYRTAREQAEKRATVSLKR